MIPPKIRFTGANVLTVCPTFLCKNDVYAILCLTGISLPLCGRGGREARSPVYIFLRAIFVSINALFSYNTLSLKQEGSKLSHKPGHSNIKTTHIYLKDFTRSEARKAHNPYVPINRFQLKKQHKRKREQE